jgi:hypothetical protein
MSDFYSVLKQSIIDRGLRSGRDREAAYSQARTAMIRRLWSYDPPLAEDEIDTRIGQFDLAVERIEGDVVEAFAAEPEPVGAAELDVSDGAPPGLPVYDGYDEEADYTPAFGGAPVESSDETDDGPADAGPPARTASEIKSLVELLTSIDIRSLAVEEALNAELQDEDARRATNDADEEEPSSEEGARALLPVPITPYRSPEDDAAFDNEPDPDDVRIEYFRVPAAERAEQASKRRTTHDNRFDDAEEPARSRGPRQDPRREARAPRPVVTGEAAAFRPKGRKSVPARRTGDRKVILLVAAVGVLAVALIAVSAYILWPMLFARGPGAVAGAPVGALPPATTAAEMPPAGNDVLQRFTLFDGSDPTIFDADPSNPIRFDGNVARISTSSDSAGARVTIGPGLASRLAGHTVRVTVMARTAKENGASGLRFAYQSGLAVSYWMTAKLTGQFSPFQLEWRLPSLQTDPSGNVILIEPGIPGEGTGADIGAITVDLLN